MGPILITGGTGRHGGTGRLIVETLLQAGRAVRVLARQEDERAAALRQRGAEVVVGDFFDLASLRSALRGVETAYFCYPVRDGIVPAAATFAAAGREEGLRTLIHMSMGAAFPGSPSPLGRAQWLAERVLDWAGFDCVHIQVRAFFFENVLTLHGHTLRSERALRNSFGPAEANWMAGEDAARLGAALLLDPGRAGQPVVLPTGGERLSHAAIAACLTEELGEPFTYREVSRDEWRADLKSAVGVGSVVNPAMVEHITSLAEAHKAVGFPPLNDEFTRLTGRPPVRFADYVRRHRDAFLQPA